MADATTEKGHSCRTDNSPFCLLNKTDLIYTLDKLSYPPAAMIAVLC